MNPKYNLTAYALTFEELVFLNKNRSYGAYILRKNYTKNLSFACIIAIILLTAGLSVSSFNKKDDTVSKVRGPRAINLVDLPQPKAIGAEQNLEKIIAPPIVKTMKFTVPKVIEDNLVKENYFPTVDELATVAISTTTQDGQEIEIIETADASIVETPKKDEDPPFVGVEEMPAYPGGVEALYAAVSNNLVYPELAKKAGITGRVTVTCIIEKDGRVTDVKVIKGIGGGCDEAAAKAVQALDSWSPGKQNGRAVRVIIALPIVFRLQ